MNNFNQYLVGEHTLAANVPTNGRGFEFGISSTTSVSTSSLKQKPISYNATAIPTVRAVISKSRSAPLSIAPTSAGILAHATVESYNFGSNINPVSTVQTAIVKNYNASTNPVASVVGFGTVKSDMGRATISTVAFELDSPIIIRNKFTEDISNTAVVKTSVPYLRNNVYKKYNTTTVEEHTPIILFNGNPRLWHVKNCCVFP